MIFPTSLDFLSSFNNQTKVDCVHRLFVTTFFSYRDKCNFYMVEIAKGLSRVAMLTLS